MKQYQLILLPLSSPASLKATGPLALASSLHPGTRFLHSVGSFPCFHLLPAAFFPWSSVSSHKQPQEMVASLRGYLRRSFLCLQEAVLNGLSDFPCSFPLQSCFPWHHLSQSPECVKVFSSGVPGLCSAAGLTHCTMVSHPQLIHGHDSQD